MSSSRARRPKAQVARHKPRQRRVRLDELTSHFIVRVAVIGRGGLHRALATATAVTAATRTLHHHTERRAQVENLASHPCDVRGPLDLHGEARRRSADAHDTGEPEQSMQQLVADAIARTVYILARIVLESWLRKRAKSGPASR
jgi:hypothetical protein